MHWFKLRSITKDFPNISRILNLLNEIDNDICTTNNESHPTPFVWSHSRKKMILLKNKIKAY